MFRGNHPAKVDDKGRLKLPSAFKQMLEARSVTQFFITSEDGESAQIWPLPDWEERENKLAPYSMDESIQCYLDQTSYYGQQVEIDSQARVLLPQILRSSAQLDEEVVVLGKMQYLEVVHRATFENRLQARKLTSEHRQRVASILQPGPVA
ncbi:division/cell wall cluster transcriptional repressor MraZ [Telmatobacter bradus]|uniref:division/cell wall cluster transcriptional repressor MraZ n=1 Tax=Telmatobacter bradus TaxID=474953 RepID=UPI003B428D7D